MEKGRFDRAVAEGKMRRDTPHAAAAVPRVLPDPRGQALLKGADTGDVAAITELLDAGVPIDSVDEVPLPLADLALVPSPHTPAHVHFAPANPPPHLTRPPAAPPHRTGCLRFTSLRGNTSTTTARSSDC